LNKLGIFVHNLGKNVTNFHWEWGPISAPYNTVENPCFDTFTMFPEYRKNPDI
jgi:hypothetical protein